MSSYHLLEKQNPEKRNSDFFFSVFLLSLSSICAMWWTWIFLQVGWLYYCRASW